MRVLLDTHVYLWALVDDPELPTSFTDVIQDPDSAVFVSAVCVWEAVIKQGLGRLEVGPDVDLANDIIASGFEELPVTAAHAAGVAQLPRLHDDPFDRLLISQARHEQLRLATVDDIVRGYPEVPLLDP